MSRSKKLKKMARRWQKSATAKNRSLRKAFQNVSCCRRSKSKTYDDGQFRKGLLIVCTKVFVSALFNFSNE